MYQQITKLLKWDFLFQLQRVAKRSRAVDPDLHSFSLLDPDPDLGEKSV